MMQKLGRREVCERWRMGPSKYWAWVKEGLLLQDMAAHELDAMMRAERAGWSVETRVELGKRILAARADLAGPAEIETILKAMQAEQPKRSTSSASKNLGHTLAEQRAAKRAADVAKKATETAT